MVSNITLTSPIRSNLLSLTNIAKQMDKTQLILATGKKVNTALDNASAYYQARSLTNRSADLNALLDAMDQGIQTIEAASQGIEKGITLLEQANAVASSALESADEIIAKVSTEDELRQAIASGKEGLIVVTADITNISSTIELKDGQSLVGASYLDENAAATKLTFDFDSTTEQHGIKVGNNALIAGLDIDFSSTYNPVDHFFAAIYADGAKNITVQDVNMNITSKSTEAGFYGIWGVMANNGAEVEVNGYSNISIDGYRSGGVFAYQSSKIDVNGQIDFIFNNATMNFGTWSHTQSTININSTAVLNVQTSINQAIPLCYNSNAFTNIHSGASLSITSNTNSNTFQGCKNEFGLGDNGYIEGNGILIEKGVNLSVKSAALGVDFGGVVSDNLFLYQAGQILGNPANYPDNIVQTGTAQVYQSTEDTTKSQPSTIFNQIVDEYNKLINDCSYQGINLLKGGNLKVVFNEHRSNVFNVLGQDITSDALGITQASWANGTAINISIAELTQAITTLRSLAESLGNQYSIIQTRADFTEGLTDILETGADELTLADMNEASAQYLSLQTRQQLALNSLSLAAQSAQSVLSLF